MEKLLKDYFRINILQQQKNNNQKIIIKKYKGNLNAEEIKKLNIKSKYELVYDIIFGLSAIHNSGLAHLDLKCDNILYEYNE